MAYKMKGFGGFKGSPAKQKEKEYNLEEEGVADTSGPRRKVVGPATGERKFEQSELINDLEDKIEFVNNDITEGKISKAEGDKITAEYEAKIAKLI